MIKPFQVNIDIWRGCDTVLPILMQYKNKLVVGEDTINDSDMPIGINETNNVLDLYEPIDWSMYAYATVAIFKAWSNVNINEEPLHKYSTNIGGLGELANGPCEPHLIGIAGKFSIITYAHSPFVNMHLPHNLTTKFNFDEAVYIVDFIKLILNDNGDKITDRLLYGKINMYGEKP